MYYAKGEAFLRPELDHWPYVSNPQRNFNYNINTLLHQLAAAVLLSIGNTGALCSWPVSATEYHMPDWTKEISAAISGQASMVIGGWWGAGCDKGLKISLKNFSA